MKVEIDGQAVAELPITVNPGIVSGAPVFEGTRVPVESLIDNLEANVTLDEYLENFPTVSRQQALQVLELSRMTVRRLGCQN